MPCRSFTGLHPSMDGQSGLRAHLEQAVALVGAARGAPRPYAELRLSVRAYTSRLRADGIPPERMLALVKSALSEKVLLAMDVDDARHLIADVVAWSIKAYYSPPRVFESRRAD